MSVLKDLYVWVSVTIVSTLCVLLLLTGALRLYDLLTEALANPSPAGAERSFRPDGAPIQNGKRNRYQMLWYDFNALEDGDAQKASETLDDFFDLGARGFRYQPWVQFSEPSFHGRWVFVGRDRLGFPVRRTPHPSRKAGTVGVLQVFVFGGSTTFSYLVADDETWPSYLAAILNERAEQEGRHFRVEVTNYGRAFYSPSQELVLLIDLLKSGYRPHWVVFMDGANLGLRVDVPNLTEKAEASFLLAQRMPLRTFRQLARGLTHHLLSPLSRFSPTEDPGPARRAKYGFLWHKPGGDWVETAAARFTQGWSLARQVCALYGCRARFFLQPHPAYGYDLSLYRTDLTTTPTFRTRIAGTRRFYERMQSESGFVDLSGLFAEWGPDRKAIVDDLHYTPSFARFLARRVAAEIDLAAVDHPELTRGVPTGLPRRPSGR